MADADATSASVSLNISLWSVHMNGQAKKQWIWEDEEKSHPKS